MERGILSLLDSVMILKNYIMVSFQIFVAVVTQIKDSLAPIGFICLEGISFYNFHWEDLTNPGIPDVMKNVHLMSYHIEKGDNILVHCHAGTGRTVVIIGCYLLYSG